LEKEVTVRMPDARELTDSLAGRPSSPVASPADLAVSLNAETTQTAAGRSGSSGSRRPRWLWAVGGATTLVLMLGGAYAWHVRSLPPPASPTVAETQTVKAPAQENPNAKVWVNTSSGTYHCPGTRWYGKTHQGQYLTQKDARDKGYHPSGGRPCT
jgi:hypothetical protein